MYIPGVRRWRGVLTLAAAALLCCMQRVGAEALDDQLPDALAFARQQVAEFAGNTFNLDVNSSVVSARANYPSYTDGAGAWYTDNAGGWSSGLFPGCLWQLHLDNPSDAQMRTWAEAWTAPEVSQVNAGHDLSFRILVSYKPWYDLTGGASEKQPILDAAASVVSTYNNNGAAVVNAFYTGSGTAPGDYKVLIDHCMDLDIVLWAARENGDAEYVRKVLSHVRVVGNNMVRPDGGTCQNGWFNSNTGMFEYEDTKQGHASWSTWSRGQAWAIYGFTTTARETGDPYALQKAQELADYFVDRLPADYVPYWDFQAPNIPDEPRDSSAGSIAASALLQLSKLAPAPAAQQKYWNAARNILTSLTAPPPAPGAPAPYLAQNTSLKSILQHGTYYKYNNSYDTGQIWGDYYFLEALERYKGLTIAPSDPSVTVTSETPEVGESGPGTGVFRFSRTGDAAQSLTVNFTILSSATAGTDYLALPTAVNIPAGAASATLALTPLPDTDLEGPEYVTLRLQADAAYSLAMPYAATVAILDDDQPTVALEVIDDDLGEAGPNTGTVRIHRVGGDPAAEVTVGLFYYGTATSGSDYAALPASVIIPGGESYYDLTVTPIDDALLEGPQTIVLELANSATAQYVVGAPRATTLTIADDESVVAGTGTGLGGTYYGNKDFTGAIVQRVDPTVDFNWGSGTPAPGIGTDGFAVRWTGKVEPQFTATYTFYTRTDDGARLWVNGVLLVDKWVNQSAKEWSGSIALSAGVQYDIRMEHYDNTGSAVAELRWSCASIEKTIIPQTQLYPNEPPTVSSIPNQTAPMNTPVGPVAFTVGDAETPAESLALLATSSNTALVPLTGIVFGGAGADRTVTVTPATDQTGFATITVQVGDGMTTASGSFVVSVTPFTLHPRLFFGPGDVAALRAKVAQEPWLGMYDRLLADKDRNSGGETAWNSSDLYDVGERAMRQAFLYVLTGADAYAQTAREMVETLITNGEWANTGVKGLALYRYGSRVAMAYDWCFDAPSWDMTFKARVSTALLRMADVIYTHGGTGQNTNAASNWQGNRYSSAGLCYLATDDLYTTANLDGAHNKVETYLQSNLGTGAADSHGWNIEGLGYNFYPMGCFVGPYGIAMQRFDPARDLRNSCMGAQWTLWSTYAASVKLMGTNLHPDFGDDNAAVSPEGTAGLAFWWCPSALHPGLVYWYDRLHGRQGTANYESRSGGTVFSILCHPGGAVAEQDPMMSADWKSGFTDSGGNGMFTWRNRYADSDDIVAQLYVKLRGNKGHSGPDGLSFRLLGLDAAWGVGGGRYGIKQNNQDAYIRSMNSLYPADPYSTLSTSGNSGVIDGTPLLKPDGSGHLVCHVATSNVKVKNWKRRFIADYSGACGAPAVYVICDTSDDGVYWQMCTIEDNPIQVSGNTFTITGAAGQTLLGTVLYPTSGWSFATGKRRRGSGFEGCDENNFVTFQSPDGDYLVVLTLAPSGTAHPPATASGVWGASPNGVVTVGGYQVAIGGDAVSYPPTIATVTPNEGPTSGGTSVTIAGASFVTGMTVAFGGSAATNVQVVSPTRLTCSTPAHSPAEAVDVVVGTGDGAATLEDGFTYLSGVPQFSVPPSANPSPAVANRVVSFNCAVSDPGGNYPVTVTWDFGDGGSASGESVAHTYRLGKVYTVEVTATNSIGQSSIATLDLIVRTTFGQFNTDADTDIVWWNSDNGNIYAWEMNGTTKVADTFLLDVDHTAYQLVGTGDFDLDGKADLLLLHPATNALYLRLMDGVSPGRFVRLCSVSATAWEVRGCCDLNGDGAADVICRQFGSGVTYVLLTSGSSTPAVTAITRLGWASYAQWELTAGAGDLNKDGRTDVLWRQKSGPTPALFVWIMNGFTVGAVVPVGSATANWQAVATGDYDGDGICDVLWRDSGAGEDLLWRMDGLVQLGSDYLEPKPGANWRIAAPR